MSEPGQVSKYVKGNGSRVLTFWEESYNYRKEGRVGGSLLLD